MQTEVVKTRTGANKCVQSKGNQMSKLTARAVSTSSAEGRDARACCRKRSLRGTASARPLVLDL